MSPEAILSGIVRDVLELPALVNDPRWDSYSTVVDVTDDSVAASAFSYVGVGAPIPSPGPRDLGAFRRLRDSMGSDGAQPWALCILRIQRDTARSTVNFVYPESASLWRVEPSTYGRIAEALRPSAADFMNGNTSEQLASEVAIEVLADGGIRMGGLVTMAAVRAAVTDANRRSVPVVVSGAVDAALAAPVIDALRRTAATVEVVSGPPAPWPHRWSSVQLAADLGFVAELEDLLARGAPAAPRRGPSAPYRLAMRRGHVPALITLRAAGVRPPRGTTPPASMPDAVVLRSWLPTWIWSVALFTAVIGLIGILATRHWAFVLVAVSGVLLVGIGNASAGAARVALDGPRLAVRPVARWHGPLDLRSLASVDYRPAPSSRMTARWRLAGPEGPIPDVVAGRDFMTPGFERHLSSWLDPRRTDISPSAAARLRRHAAAE